MYECPLCGEKLRSKGLLTFHCDLCDQDFDIEEVTDDDDSTYTQDFDEFSDADPGL